MDELSIEVILLYPYIRQTAQHKTVKKDLSHDTL